MIHGHEEHNGEKVIHPAIMTHKDKLFCHRFRKESEGSKWEVADGIGEEDHDEDKDGDEGTEKRAPGHEEDVAVEVGHDEHYGDDGKEQVYVEPAFGPTDGAGAGKGGVLGEKDEKETKGIGHACEQKTTPRRSFGEAKSPIGPKGVGEKKDKKEGSIDEYEKEKGGLEDTNSKKEKAVVDME
jgi:hypothetical protein